MLADPICHANWRIGWVLAESGRLDDAERKTDDVERLVIKGTDSMVIRAKLKLKKLSSQLKGGPLYDMFGDSGK